MEEDIVITCDLSSDRVWVCTEKWSLIRQNGSWISGIPSADDLKANFKLVVDSKEAAHYFLEASRALVSFPRTA
jgi:hypothetical protein